MSLILLKHTRSLCLWRDFPILKDKGCHDYRILQKGQSIGTYVIFKDHPEYSGIHMVRFKRKTIYHIPNGKPECLHRDCARRISASMPASNWFNSNSTCITPMPFIKTTHTVVCATPSITFSRIMIISAFLNTKPTRDIWPYLVCNTSKMVVILHTAFCWQQFVWNSYIPLWTCFPRAPAQNTTVSVEVITCN